MPASARWPCTDWFDFYTAAPYNGGPEGDGGRLVTLDAPYGRIPLLVRSGSIIPFGPSMQWSDEKPADVINLYVYTGRDGEFTLYEDENVNYNYEKGRYTMIPIVWNDKTSTLTIGERKGEFPGMLRNRRFNIIKVYPGHGGYDPAAKGIEVAYNGAAKKVKL